MISLGNTASPLSVFLHSIPLPLFDHGIIFILWILQQKMHGWQHWDIHFSLLHVSSVQFSSVTQSCPTLWDPMNHSMPGLPVHHQSWSSLKLMSIESVMPSSHLIFCCPLLLLPSLPASVFSNETFTENESHTFSLKSVSELYKVFSQQLYSGG